MIFLCSLKMKTSVSTLREICNDTASSQHTHLSHSELLSVPKECSFTKEVCGPEAIPPCYLTSIPELVTILILIFSSEKQSLHLNGHRLPLCYAVV